MVDVRNLNKNETLLMFTNTASRKPAEIIESHIPKTFDILLQ